MKRTPLIAVLAAMLMTTACDNFSAVQKADTIAAYETYIAENPDSRMMLQAKTRLEELYLKQAKDQGTLEAYDQYLAKFPEGTYVEKAMKEREEFLYTWAKGEDSADSWNKYLSEYPKGDKKRRKEARAAISMAEYADKLSLGAAVVERVNLAEDPEGEPNGWGISVDVTNNGDRVIEDLRLKIRFMSGEEVLGEKTWPVVAKNWGVPMEEEKKVPMQPGDTRTWFWMDSFPEESWGKQVKVTPATIRYVEAEDE